jgi:hypothetical protein
LFSWQAPASPGEVTDASRRRALIRPTTEQKAIEFAACAVLVKTEAPENTGLIRKRATPSTRTFKRAWKPEHAEEFFPGGSKNFIRSHPPDAAPRQIHPEHARQTSELAPTISELADMAADDYAAVSF